MERPSAPLCGALPGNLVVSAGVSPSGPARAVVSTVIILKYLPELAIRKCYVRANRPSSFFP